MYFVGDADLPVPRRRLRHDPPARAFDARDRPWSRRWPTTALHPARRDHGLPVHHPGHSLRVRQLPRPAHDRRPGRGLSTAGTCPRSTSTLIGAAFRLWGMIPAAPTPVGPSTRPTAPTRRPRSPHAPRGLPRRLPSILTGLNFIVTIHTLRAGHELVRLPLFVWVDLRHQHHPGAGHPGTWASPLARSCRHIFGFGIFDPARGGDPDPLPTPLLVLLPPRGLHHDPPGDGGDQRGRLRLPRKNISATG